MGARRASPDSTRRLTSPLGIPLSIASSMLTVAIVVALARTIASVFDDEPSGTGTLVVLIALVATRALLLLFVRPILTRDASSRSRRLRRDVLANAVEGRRGTVVAPLAGAGIDALDEHLVDYVPVRIAAMVMPVVVLVVVAVIDPITAIILLFTGPMLVTLLALIGLRTRDLAARRVTELGWLRSSFLDLIRGLPTLQVHGRADEIAVAVRESSDRFAATTLDVLRTAFQTSLVIEWAATAATALVAVQIAFRLAGGHVEFIGALTALMLTPEFFVPWRDLAAQYHVGQHGDAVLIDLQESGLDEPSRSLRTASDARIEGAPRIEFDAVGFSHGDRRVLDRVSFVIEPGEIVAITGSSGAGKSTLASLLLGLERPATGIVSVDRSPVADITDGGSCAWVPQHASCFSGTVRSNLLLGRADATDEELWDALERVDLTRTIASLPSGLDTAIGEGGRRLSAGQRQRLAIARAVVARRRIEVFDEFTALLDLSTERRVLNGVLRRPGTRTTLLIAHRSASIELADRVFVLVDGRLESVR